MICPKCGYQIPDICTLCPECGYKKIKQTQQKEEKIPERQSVGYHIEFNTTNYLEVELFLQLNFGYLINGIVKTIMPKKPWENATIGFSTKEITFDQVMELNKALAVRTNDDRWLNLGMKEYLSRSMQVDAPS